MTPVIEDCNMLLQVTSVLVSRATRADDYRRHARLDKRYSWMMPKVYMRVIKGRLVDAIDFYDKS